LFEPAEDEMYILLTIVLEFYDSTRTVTIIIKESQILTSLI